MSTNTENEPAGVRRLREARERLSLLRAEEARLADAALPLKPGDQFHAKRTGTTFATGGGLLSASHISRAGETYTVTAQLIEASRDAGGRSWFRHLVSDEAQIAVWKEVRFGLGPAPADAPTWDRRGGSDWTEQRNAAKAEAWAMPTEQARREALAAVEARFGPAVTTATYSKYLDPSIKLAEEQRAALDAGGVRHVSHFVAQEPGVAERR